MQMRDLEARRQFKQAWLPLRHDRLLIPHLLSLSPPPLSLCFTRTHTHTHTHRYKVTHACWHTKLLRKVKQPETLKKHKCESSCHKNVQMHMQNAQALWKCELYSHTNPFNPTKTLHIYQKRVCSSKAAHIQFAHSHHYTHTHIILIIISQLEIGSRLNQLICDGRHGYTKSLHLLSLCHFEQLVTYYSP